MSEPKCKLLEGKPNRRCANFAALHSVRLHGWQLPHACGYCNFKEIINEGKNKGYQVSRLQCSFRPDQSKPAAKFITETTSIIILLNFVSHHCGITFSEVSFAKVKTEWDK
ncbi:MAG TPA: hypothetical protein VGO47_07775 [Chlamydiales bacterium]|nr:hypothetical protein [Chlamydiales bacterium]